MFINKYQKVISRNNCGDIIEQSAKYDPSVIGIEGITNACHVECVSESYGLDPYSCNNSWDWICAD